MVPEVLLLPLAAECSSVLASVLPVDWELELPLEFTFVPEMRPSLDEAELDD